MSIAQKKELYRILGAGVLFTTGMVLSSLYPVASYGPFLLFLSFGIAGWEVLWATIENLRKGEFFDECFLMTVATLGAFALGDYAEGAAVMLFFQVGEWFQTYAVEKSRRSITELMDIRPDAAMVERNQQVVVVKPEEVAVGETLVVKPGERIPLDGEVLAGNSLLDTSALTGESLPRAVKPGMQVVSGCINQTGQLRIRTTKTFGESTVVKILALVEHSSAKKAPAEKFITAFSRFYTPAVVLGAAALAVLPPLFTGEPFSVWVYRALTFLVISCPCALVISIPLTFFAGIGGASRCGILVKGGNYLEVLAKTQQVAFDKTGTLTRGCFTVTNVQPVARTDAELLELAAYAEAASNHPLAVSILQAFGGEIDRKRISAVEEVPGQGIRLVLDGKEVLAGHARLLEHAQILLPQGIPEGGTVIHLAEAGRYAGSIFLADELKSDAALTIRELKEAGVEKTILLTGDQKDVGEEIAAQLGIDEVYTQLLPADKVTKVEGLLTYIKERNPAGKLAFVGDGINDAPVLARADVGIAMGGMGSDAAIEAADIVLMTDEPSKLVTAREIARKTLRIARQNIIFAIGVKGVVLFLGALGYASMWAAVFADVGVAILAIFNAMRALRVKDVQKMIRPSATLELAKPADEV